MGGDTCVIWLKLTDRHILVPRLLLRLSHAAAEQEDDEDEDEGDEEEPEAAGTAPAGAQGNLDANAANGVAADAGDSPEGVNPQVRRRRSAAAVQQLHAGLTLHFHPVVRCSAACSHWQMCLLWLLQEIRRDAFWLQRRVSSAFGSLDAAEAQQLAEKIFRTLEVKLCILHVLAHHVHSSV